MSSMNEEKSDNGNFKPEKPVSLPGTSCWVWWYYASVQANCERCATRTFIGARPRAPAAHLLSVGGQGVSYSGLYKALSCMLCCSMLWFGIL